MPVCFFPAFSLTSNRKLIFPRVHKTKKVIKLINQGLYKGSVYYLKFTRKLLELHRRSQMKVPITG